MADRLPISFKIIQKSLEILPFGVRLYFIKLLANVAFYIDKNHTKAAFVNLDLAFGDTLSSKEKRAIAIRAYENLIAVGIDTILNQGKSRDYILSKVEFENSKVLEDAIRSGKNIIFITAHYGNWELGTLAIAAKFNIPLSVVGRRLDLEYANTILKATRGQFGIEMIDKRNAMRNMVKALKNRRALGVVVDQNTRRQEGILIDFFGKKARHTPSVSILARKFDATVIPVYSYSDDFRKWKIRFEEPLSLKKSEDINRDIEEFTQKQANITEEVIRRKPNEWLWLHKRWKNQYKELYK